MAHSNLLLADNRFRQRMTIGLVVSTLINAAAFAFVGALFRRQILLLPSEPMQVTLNRIERRPLPTPSPRPTSSAVPTPTPTPRPTPRPTPTPKPIATPTPRPLAQPTPLIKATPPPSPIHSTRPRPEGAHNHIITRRPDATAKANDFTVLPGGNARPGEPLAQQSAGNARTAPDGPTAPVPATPTPAAPARVAPAPAAPFPTPAPEPTPTAPPKASGPTRDAEPTNTVKPSIPDSLKQGQFKSFVRVRVEVSDEGTASPVLRTSSGNSEIDQLVLEALKRWKWKPALKNGAPVDSVQLFKFEFEVN